MPHERKFRFGAQVASAGSADDWRALARQVEDLGYSTLAMPDHFVNREWAPLPALVATAEATESLRVGTLVCDNDFKHPVVLAKEAATIDVLSGGRLEFGLGAGWLRADYETSGIPYDEASVRVDRFEEGLRVVKGLWGDGPLSFEGEHYTIRELDGFPKPVQQPRPPVVVGGGGPRVLQLAAREADIIGLNANLKAGEVSIDMAKSMTAEATEEKLGWIREAAADRFDDLEIQVLVFIVTITDDPEGTLEVMAPTFGLTPAEAAAVPHALVGSVESIVDELEERRERHHISYVTVQGREAVEAFAPIVAKLAGT